MSTGHDPLRRVVDNALMAARARGDVDPAVAAHEALMDLPVAARAEAFAETLRVYTIVRMYESQGETLPGLST